MLKTRTLPTKPEELTAVWLSDVLMANGTLGETAVSALVVEPMVGAGYVGQVARVFISYDAAYPAGPTSLIAKFSNPDPNVREALHNLYVKEVHIYRELAEQIDLTMPHCYHSELDNVMSMQPDTFIPDTFLQLGDAIAQQLQAIHDQTTCSPYTLAHRDTHIDNLMFSDMDDDPPLTVIDWQLCGNGIGVSDIAYFLIFSMSVRIRRQNEKQLIKAYHAQLLEHGVTNYDFEQCWQDYRLAYFRNFRVAVVVVGLIDLSRDHGQEFLSVMIPRLASFAEDHNVSEFLR